MSLGHADTTATKRPERVLFCTLAYHPAAAGGAEHQARLQAEELLRRGYEVTVVCARSHGLRSGSVNGVTVCRLPRSARAGCGTISYLLVLTMWLLIKGRSFGLWHVHLANLQSDVAVSVGHIVRRPVYVKVAAGGGVGEIGRLRKVARVTRWTGLRRATRVQALSEEIVTELIGIGVKRDRIVRIPNGIDLSKFDVGTPARKAEARAALDLPSERVIALYVGRFARYKGIADLFAAWERASESGALLVTVGALALDSPFPMPPDNPSFVKRDWTAHVVDYLHAADIFVYPSHGDGMSNALLEALACSLAIVATEIPAAVGLLQDGQNSLTVPPHCPEELATGVCRLVADDSLRSRLGHAARATAADHSITAVVDQIESAYAEMLAHC